MLDYETSVRTGSQRKKVLKELRENGEAGVLNSRLLEISNNYTARTAELTKMGYVIECVNLGGGIFKYILRHEPEVPETQKRAIDMFWEIFEDQYDGIADRDVLEEIFETHGLNVVRNWGTNKQQQGLYPKYSDQVFNQ